MKRFFLIELLFLMSCAFVMAQGNLFKEAIKRGSNNLGVYHIENPKKKPVTEEKMREYLSKNGFIAGKSTTQKAVIYGNVMTIVSSMDFISVDGKSKYAFSQLDETGINPNQLKGSGTAFLPTRREIKQDAIIYVRKYEIVYERIDNIEWSGTIQNGLINGNGVGIAKVGNNYVYIKGTFSNGIAVSDGFVKRINMASNENLAIKAKNVSRSNFIGVDSYATTENAKISDPQLSQALNLQFTKTYKEDAKKLESSYQKAKTISVNNLGNQTYDDTPAKFVLTYTKANYDPDRLIPKAQEIQDIYTVISVSKMQFRNRYYASRFLIGFGWCNDWVNEDQAKIHNAQSIIKARKVNSQYGFKNLFSQMESVINNKNKAFGKKIDDDQYDYKQELARRDRSNRNYSGGGWSSGGSSSSKSGVDVEQIKISDFSYEVDDEWYSNAGDDILDRYRKEVRFKDNDGSLKGYIFIDDKKRYSPWIDAGAGSSYSYDSWNNLIVALYAYKKYGRIRKTGRK